MNDDAGHLGASDGLALIVATMVGTGIFTTSGFLLRDLGSPLWVLVAWVLGGGLALCGALCYAELGAMMPRAGGEYVYLREAFHPMFGFVAGVVSLFAGFSAPIAATAMAFGAYLEAAIPAVPAKLSASLLVVVATAAHAAGARRGVGFQRLWTGLKIALIVVFIIGAAISEHVQIDRLRFTVDASRSQAGFWVGLIFVTYAYTGWNAVAYVASEFRAPTRVLPRALWAGTLTVTLLYLALNLAFFVVAAPDTLIGQLDVGFIAGRAIFGPQAARLLSLAIAGLLVSSVGAMVMTGPRVYAAMAEDGLFPGLFTRRRDGAPYFSVILQGMLALAFLLSSSFDVLLLYAGLTLSVTSALTVAAAAWLRVRAPDRPRPFRAPALALAAAIYFALNVWMIVHALDARPVESTLGLMTLGLGAGLYRFFRPRETS